MIPITSLSSYLYCPIKFYIEQIEGEKKIDHVVTMKGKLKHKCLEKISNNEQDIIEKIGSIKDFESLCTAYKMSFLSSVRKELMQARYELDDLKMPIINLFSDFKPLFELEAMQRAKNVFEFHEKTKLLGKELWKELTPKLLTEKPLHSKEYLLNGKIDRLELWNDKVVPIEFKNRESSQLYDSQKTQLGAYILVSNGFLGKNCNHGYMHFLKDNQRKLVLMNDFLKDEIISTRDKVIDVLENQKIANIKDVRISEGKCRICPYVEKCKKVREN